MPLVQRTVCEICGGAVAPCAFNKRSVSLAEVASFNVTDQSYGTSLPLVRCPECGLVQTAELLDSAAIQPLYATPDPHYLATSRERGLSNYIQVARALRATGAAPGSIFEIGAGSGAMLYFFKQNGWQTAGVETNPLFCDFARNTFGVQLSRADLATMPTNERYDVVAAIDVIEHMTSLTSFMASARRLLKPGGRLVIVTPNRASLVARLMGRRWWHIRPPHLYYLSVKNIIALGAKENLRPVTVKRFAWRHTLGYLIECVQSLLFKRVLIPFSWLKIPVYINTLDSCLVVLKADEPRV